MYFVSVLGVMWLTRYTPRCSGINSPFSSRWSIAFSATLASRSSRLVTRPRRGAAILAMRCSTVLTLPSIKGEKSGRWPIRPLDVDVYDHRREQQRQVGERRQVEAQRGTALAGAEELYGQPDEGRAQHYR